MKSIPEIEQEILKFWKDQNIFQKVLAKESPKGDFVFYEGPPTANGKPGVHHVLSRAYKDIIPRFKTMQGYWVKRKAGWDTHGLPVELEVEKRLGLKNKKDIEAYGIEKFNEECKKSVWQYKDLWERFTERMGYWVDMEHPYITYTNEYIESLWWVVKQFYDKGLLYQGHKVVPHCPRCGTALSSHEVAQGYKTIKEPSVYLKFLITDGSESQWPLRVRQDGTTQTSSRPPFKTYILTWTTTPWTLPGNVALAVGADITYVLVKQNGEHYILAKDCLGILEGEYTVIEEVKGSELSGFTYKPLFDSLIDLPEKKHFVTVADFVSTTDGTGVVHTAAMYGEDDYRLGDAIGLPKVHTVNEDGTFNERVPQWQGKFVKDVEKEITEDLQKRGLLFKVMEYEHDYPFCWRCDTPLLYFAKPSWFVAMSSLREQLIRNNQQINWVPVYIKDGRFGEWLKEVKDWAFSRERYWGTPLPIWKCTSSSVIPDSIGNPENKNKKQKDCGDLKVIGSIQELEELCGKKLDDLHKPFIDEIAFPCKRCSGTMRRVPEVCDVWFDSGAMPFAQVHFPFEQLKKPTSVIPDFDPGSRNKKKKEKNFFDFSFDFLDPNFRWDDKKVMELVKQIEFPADYIAEAIDQTRGWFYTLLAVSTALGLPVPFKNVICMGHILDKNGQKMSKSKGNVVDPWDMFMKFGADPLRYYLYSMNDAGLPKRFNEDELKDVSNRVFGTLFNVVSFYKLFAGDHKIGNVEPKDLVHVLDQWITAKLNALTRTVTLKLDQYDVTSASRAIGEFVNELSVWYVRRSRERFKSEDQAVKTPALKTLRHVIFNVSRLLAPFCPFVSEQIYFFDMKGGRSVHMAPWAYVEHESKEKDSEVLTNMEVVRNVVSLALEQRASNGIPVRQPLQKLRVMRHETRIMYEYIELIKDEVNIKEVEMVEGKGALSVELDLTISEELKKEGLVREITRLVNDLRKKHGLTIQDRVVVVYDGDEEIKKVIEEYREQLEKATLANKWKAGVHEHQIVLQMKDHAFKVLFEG